ncbi:hypothetical protein LTS18_010437, partial [Coniosporium uncinatum]
ASAPSGEFSNPSKESNNNHSGSDSPEVEESQKTSGFLDLPAELRNRIYELLIWEDEVLQRYSPILPPQVKHLQDAKNFEDQTYGHLKAGAVHGHKKHTALYRINRQINREATSLARQTPMTWIVVDVDIQNYSAQLAKAKFPVTFRCGADHVPNPAMTITIRCRQAPRTEQDCFVVRNDHVEELFRALNMTTGKIQMDISFFLHKAPSEIAPSLVTKERNSMLTSAMRLRGVGKVSINGCGSWDEQLQEQALNVSISMQFKPLVQDMNKYLEVYQQMGDEYHAKNKLESAITIYTNGLAYAGDCVKLWFKSTTALSMSPSNHFLLPTQHGDFDMRCYALGSSLAMCYIKMGWAMPAAWYATYALSDHRNTLLGMRAKAYHARGVAFMMLGHYIHAAHDLFMAQKFAPGDAEVEKQIELLKGPLATLFPGKEDVLLEARKDIAAILKVLAADAGKADAAR